MKQLERIRIAMVLVCALSLAAGVAIGAAAQEKEKPAKIHGQVSDSNGNPFTGATVSVRNSTTGQSTDLTADAQGRYRSGNLPAGTYSVDIKVQGKSVYSQIVNLTAGQDTVQDFNFKEIQSQQNAQAAEAAKKNEEAKAKFAVMKQHFDAGTAALEQAKQLRAQVEKMPKDQQAASQGQLDQATGTAVNEFNAALEQTNETDPNRNIVLARMGEAYEIDNKYADAATAYSKAVALKPDPSYYNNLGNSLARTGKTDEALQAYQKAIEMDPMNTAMYWRNFAIGLYNSGRIKESVDPLKKATDADPKNAQAWYLLGAALVNTMGFKQEGDKMVPELQPGTQEAYQKAIELDPNGVWGAQAKQGLEALQAMGVGIDTKLSTRPAKDNKPKDNKKK
ncbi:MAG TPA: carboxypeptidase regulatory-like domain-containing protein [Candidatus Acidoferrales bacterium]|jgi:tetratricopeptide (TPR) repeat protein|nr:carboxypeptidase regulatory-like domain-containing protein [Candidatus Acidoferrales bacterium]